MNETPKNALGGEKPNAVNRLVVGMGMLTVIVAILAIWAYLEKAEDRDAQFARIQAEIGNPVVVSDLSDANVVAADQDRLTILGRDAEGHLTVKNYARDDPRIM